MSELITDVLALIHEQRRQKVPEDELLIPPEYYYRAISELNCVFFPQGTATPSGASESMVCGARFGVPCPKCKRRKPNKGKDTCDGCGYPYRRY